MVPHYDRCGFRFASNQSLTHTSARTLLQRNLTQRHNRRVQNNAHTLAEDTGGNQLGRRATTERCTIEQKKTKYKRIEKIMNYSGGTTTTTKVSFACCVRGEILQLLSIVRHTDTTSSSTSATATRIIHDDTRSTTGIVEWTAESAASRIGPSSTSATATQIIYGNTRSTTGIVEWTAESAACRRGPGKSTRTSAQMFPHHTTTTI